MKAPCSKHVKYDLRPDLLRGRSQEERLVAIMEMTGPFQSPSDRFLWILAHHGGKMKRGRLRAATGMRYAMLIPILDELIRCQPPKSFSFDASITYQS
jgi:hypothetical protein